jgi:acyl carrier protein
MVGSDDLRGFLVRLIAIELAIAEEKVLAARSLREDLGMDSIHAANILFALEDELGIEFLEIPRVDTLAGIESAIREWAATRST